MWQCLKSNRVTELEPLAVEASLAQPLKTSSSGWAPQAPWRVCRGKFKRFFGNPDGRKRSAYGKRLG
jgi:hypothetical protein